MSQSLETFIICPTMMILRNQKILLLRRTDRASFWPNHWHCPVGKMEKGESPLKTIIRETNEELGLKVNPRFGTAVAVIGKSFHEPDLIYKNISLFFVAKEFYGEPVNKEPYLHDAMDWFDVHNLPEPIIPFVKFGIEQYLRGETYGEFGYSVGRQVN